MKANRSYRFIAAALGFWVIFQAHSTIEAHAPSSLCKASLGAEALLYSKPNNGGHGDVERDGDFAVKRAKSEKSLQYLMREMLIYKRLKSAGAPDGIPRYEGFNQGASGAEIRTEWIEGETLLEHTINSDVNGKNFKNKSKEFLGLTRQFLGTLSWMHTNNFLHLDLKPSNIMITKEGKVKIIDFGGAVQLDGSSFISRPITYTDGFAAKELKTLVDNGASKIDAPLTPATDMFAVGKIINSWVIAMREEGARPALSSRMDKILTDVEANIIIPLTKENAHDRITMQELMTRLAAFEHEIDQLP